MLERHPETAARLRQVLADYRWDTRPANVDRQRIIVGNGRENPARLNPMDWARTSSNSSARIPFYPGFAEHRPDTEIKGWIGREREYRSLPWYLTVAETGRYGVSLYLHDTPAGRRIGITLCRPGGTEKANRRTGFGWGDVRDDRVTSRGGRHGTKGVVQQRCGRIDRRDAGNVHLR